MARRRKRKAVNWGPVLGVLLIINVVVGLALSQVTGVRRARVVGSPPTETARISRILESLRGRPFALISNDIVASEVLESPDLVDARLKTNLFGSSVLTVSARKAVAAIQGYSGTFLDERGTLFRSQREEKALPLLHLEPGFIQANAAVTANWPSGPTASLCRSLAHFPELAGATVHLDGRGRLWLSRDGLARVELGGAEALDEKLRRLRGLLDEQPSLLKSVKSLTLTDPARPAVVPRGSRQT